MALDLFVVLIYAAGMLLLGYYGMRKAKTNEDFLVAGRNLGPSLYMGTMPRPYSVARPPSAPCVWATCTASPVSGCARHWAAASSR